MWLGQALEEGEKQNVVQCMSRAGFSEGEALAEQICHYQCDHIGNPIELLDSGGGINWAAYQRAWGTALSTTKVRAKQALRFQGQYQDEETGLCYNLHRYYDADAGRYLSQDPVGLLGGGNLYQYVADPVSWIDPLGLKKSKRNLEGRDASGRPLCSGNYSVWAQVELPAEQWGKKRPDHFKYANEQLHKRVLENPELAKSLPATLIDHIKPGARGGYSDESPPGMSWHHNEQNPKIIELIPRAQHRAPGPVQESLHPKQGGGFKKLQSGCVT